MLSQEHLRRLRAERTADTEAERRKLLRIAEADGYRSGVVDERARLTCELSTTGLPGVAVLNSMPQNPVLRVAIRTCEFVQAPYDFRLLERVRESKLEFESVRQAYTVRDAKTGEPFTVLWWSWRFARNCDPGAILG